MLKWLSLLDGEWVFIVWNLLETEDEFRHVDMFMNKRRENLNIKMFNEQDHKIKGKKQMMFMNKRWGKEK